MLIDQNMTIYTAAALKAPMLVDVRQAEAPEFDLSGVTEIDSAGLQLLLLARREAANAGLTLRIIGVRPAVSEVLCFVSLAATTHQRFAEPQATSSTAPQATSSGDSNEGTDT